MASLGLLTNAVSHSQQDGEMSTRREPHDPALSTCHIYYGGAAKRHFELLARSRTASAVGQFFLLHCGEFFASKNLKLDTCLFGLTAC
jgi:hypothetical protein